MSRRLTIATFVALVASTTAAMSQEAPDLIGTWTGKMVGGAYFGALNHSPPKKDPVFVDRTKEWALTIEKQEGSGLIGTWSSKTKTEKIAGAIRQDNVTVIFADEDNIFDARLLSANEMELCAQEGGAAKGGATVALCWLMKRK